MPDEIVDLFPPAVAAAIRLGGIGDGDLEGWDIWYDAGEDWRYAVVRSEDPKPTHLPASVPSALANRVFHRACDYGMRYRRW